MTTKKEWDRLTKSQKYEHVKELKERNHEPRSELSLTRKRISELEKKGYALMCDVNGKLYVYAKKETKP